MCVEGRAGIEPTSSNTVVLPVVTRPSAPKMPVFPSCQLLNFPIPLGLRLVRFYGKIRANQISISRLLIWHNQSGVETGAGFEPATIFACVGSRPVLLVKGGRLFPKQWSRYNSHNPISLAKPPSTPMILPRLPFRHPVKVSVYSRSSSLSVVHICARVAFPWKRVDSNHCFKASP